MKKVLFFLVAFNFSTAFSQNDSTIQIHSNRILKRMDSVLELSNTQRVLLHKQTVLLFEEKVMARNNHTSINRNDLQKKLQLIENKRDSLYSLILSGEMFKIYKDRKGYILSGNR